MSTTFVLWTDDHVGKFGHWIVLLKKVGLHVHTAINSADALRQAAKRRYAAFFVDARLDNEQGTELLLRLQAAQPRAKFAAVTSFRHEYEDKIEALPFQVPLIEKPDSEADTRAFIESLKAIALPANEGDLASHEESAHETHVEPLELSPEELLAMSDEEQFEVFLKVKEECAKVLNESFAAGAIWVLICGDSRTVAASAKMSSEIWSDTEVSFHADQRGRAAFQFTAPTTVDDMWSPNCNRGDGLSGYPTVTFEFSSSPNQFDFHFDTGAPTTFFRYEEMNALDPSSLSKNRMLGTANGHNYMAIQFGTDATVCDQVDSQKKAAIRLSGHAVKNWLITPFCRMCIAGDCKTGPVSMPQVCKYRRALVGRDFVSNNKLQVVLDGVNGRTRLLLPGDEA